MIEHFIITTAAAVGATMIVVRSKLFEAVRAWCGRVWDKDKLTPAYMINCPQCSGVWIGLIYSILFAPHQIIAVSMATSVISMLIDQVYFTLTAIERYCNKE